MKIKPVILVGGKSRRFGTDKFFLVLNGNLVFERTYRILKSVFGVEPVFIGRQAPISNYEFREDLIPSLGPIGGLYTALKLYNDVDFVFLVACDMPLIKKEVLEYMKATLNGQSFSYIPKLENGFIEPMFAFYSSKLLPIVERNIKANDLKLRSLLIDKVQYLEVYKIKDIDPELLSFLNINTKSDFDRICSIIKNENIEDFAI